MHRAFPRHSILRGRARQQDTGARSPGQGRVLARAHPQCRVSGSRAGAELPQELLASGGAAGILYHSIPGRQCPQPTLQHPPPSRDAGPHPPSRDPPPRAGAGQAEDVGAQPPSVLLQGRTWGRSRLKAASQGTNSLTSTLPVAASLQHPGAEGLRGALNGREGAFLISFSSISAVP